MRRIARDEIDPDLVKLSRPPPKIGVITAAGLVFLCVFFLIRLGPDRRFGGKQLGPRPRHGPPTCSPARSRPTSLILLPAEPLVSHAIRTTTAKASLGLRVVPVRGTGDRLWIAASEATTGTPRPRTATSGGSAG